MEDLSSRIKAEIRSMSRTLDNYEVFLVAKDNLHQIKNCKDLIEEKKKDEKTPPDVKKFIDLRLGLAADPHDENIKRSICELLKANNLSHMSQRYEKLPESHLNSPRKRSSFAGRRSESPRSDSESPRDNESTELPTSDSTRSGSPRDLLVRLVSFGKK
jgi:hypothetical protein